jgi:hypothetical protein
MSVAPMVGDRASDPVAPIGMAALAKMAFDCVDLGPLQQALTQRSLHDAGDAAALIDLSTIKLLGGARDEALRLQAMALQQNRLYRRRPDSAKADAIRLLAFVAPGDFMANAPLEFLLDGSNVTLDLLYIVPGAPLPPVIPEHDLAIVAVGESDQNRAVLREIAALIRDWQRPVLNVPSRIADLSRDAACGLLHEANGTAIPATLRVARVMLERIATGAAAVESILDRDLPIIARPIGSHAGDGLLKLDDAPAVAGYLAVRPEDEFYISPFIDYRSADGLFRKYRIALIDGRPYACHMAVSQHWMVHYLNAGMTESAAKRDEEARFMAAFDDDFAMRHAAAFRAIAERVGLAYFAIDCGELPDGRLLLFEADVAMIIHAMDPPDMFPYKRPQMRKVFAAFAAMLRKYAQPAGG